MRLTNLLLIFLLTMVPTWSLAGIGLGATQGRYLVVSSTGTTLNTGNTYGQNTQRMYLFDEDSGTNVNDYGDDGVDATLSSSGIWGTNGIQIDAEGEYASTSMPGLGSTESFFILFTSTGASGDGFSRLFAQNTDDGSLDIRRNNSDTSLTMEIVEGSYSATIPDIWDTNLHSLLITYNDSTNLRKTYVDGVLKHNISSSFTASGFSSTFIVGNRGDYARPAMATIHAMYIWDVELDQTAATSLENSPYQMFNNPPSR